MIVVVGFGIDRRVIWIVYFYEVCQFVECFVGGVVDGGVECFIVVLVFDVDDLVVIV